jgi:hypothetical protein
MGNGIKRDHFILESKIRKNIVICLLPNKIKLLFFEKASLTAGGSCGKSILVWLLNKLLDLRHFCQLI